jgi:hypothetical protein
VGQALTGLENSRNLRSSLNQPINSSTRYSTAILAIIPVVGIALAYIYQVGRFAYLEVPTIFIELDPTRVAQATLWISFFLAVYALGWSSHIDHASRSPWYFRVLGHLFINGLLTTNLWWADGAHILDADTIGTAALLTIPATAATFWVSHYVRSYAEARELGAEPKFSSVGRMFLVALLGAVLSLFAFVGGYSREQRTAYRWINKDTYMLVDTFNGNMVLKPLKNGKLSKGQVVVVSPERAGVLVQAEITLSRD